METYHFIPDSQGRQFVRNLRRAVGLRLLRPTWNANQYSTIVLELADDATMTKDSWVKMGKCYDVPLRVVRPYKSSDLLCQLTPESCRAVRDFIESNPPDRD